MVLNSKKVDLIHSDVIFREDGIVEIVFKKSSNIGVVECKEMIETYKSNLEPKKFPLLHIIEDYVNIEKSAREFSATEEGLSFSKAEAYVMNSLAHKMLANFYMKVNKPSVPTRFFKDKNEAIDWLKGFL
jgi:hypothetical protein